MGTRNNWNLVILFVFCTFLAGCASIIQGTTQNIGISSTPSGASVTIDNRPYGQTPVVAQLSRKDNHTIKIELAGYETAEYTLTRSVSGWVCGNIIFGGLIGLAVDAISGGMYKLTPEQVNANLSKSNTASIIRSDGIYIAVEFGVNPEWEKIGQLKRK